MVPLPLGYIRWYARRDLNPQQLRSERSASAVGLRARADAKQKAPEENPRGRLNKADENPSVHAIPRRRSLSRELFCGTDSKDDVSRMYFEYLVYCVCQLGSPERDAVASQAFDPRASFLRTDDTQQAAQLLLFAECARAAE
jgi:hypothetical protein